MSGPKLYRATVEIEVLFVADDTGDAHHIAAEMLREEVDDNGVEAVGGNVAHVEELRSISEVPPHWLRALPRNLAAHGLGDMHSRDFFIEEAEANGEPR